MVGKHIIAIVGVALSAACAAAKQPSIVGTWKLVSYELEFQDNGERRPGLGENPHGYLVFTSEGRMIGYAEAAGRKQPTNDAEQAEAFRTLRAYTGKYRLEEDKWITKVDGSWLPAWLGTEQERTFEIQGDRLSVVANEFRSASQPGRVATVHLTYVRER